MSCSACCAAPVWWPRSEVSPAPARATLRLPLVLAQAPEQTRALLQAPPQSTAQTQRAAAQQSFPQQALRR